MEKGIILCADEASVGMPELIGLDGEDLTAQPWLSVQWNAQQAREQARQSNPHEVWVVGCEGMEPINVAAAMKRDAAHRKVCLVAFQGTGSLMSRAKAAGIDAVMDRPAFVKRYAQCKGEALQACAIDRPAGCSVRNEPLQQPVKASASSVTAQKADPGKEAFVLTVVGAGGGVGKSTVAVLAACLAQGMGHKTLLVDADLQFGDASYLIGAEHPLRADDLLDHPRFVERLRPEGRLPAVLAAPERLEKSEEVAPLLGDLMQMLKPHFGVIVVNTGPVWADGHMMLMERSANTLFVVDQRPSSIRACRHALEVCARCGVPSQPFRFALNRCARGALFSSIDVSCALQGASVAELQDGGRAVEELLGAGQPLDLIDDANGLCVSLENLLADLLPTCECAAAPVPPRSARRIHLPGHRRRAACL